MREPVRSNEPILCTTLNNKAEAQELGAEWNINPPPQLQP